MPAKISSYLLVRNAVPDRIWGCDIGVFMSSALDTIRNSGFTSRQSTRSERDQRPARL